MVWKEWLSLVLLILGIPPLISKWIPLLKNWYKCLTYIGLVLVIIALVLFVLIMVGGGGTNCTPDIKITSPAGDALVPLETTVKGYSGSAICKERHLYIVVEYGGRWWPQVSEIYVGLSQVSRQYEFTAPCRIGQETDQGKQFIIRAILVDLSVHQQFQNWFQKNAGSNEWQGIPTVEANQWGSITLSDYISVTRQ